jgi:pyruvate-formate lyase
VERRMLMDAPKFGNDDPEADAFALEIFDFINIATKETGQKLGADVSLASHVGVDANVYLGRIAIASPDGRLCGQPLTNSINPLPGQDRNGVTALLNSMAKFRPDSASGLVMHLKLSREMFTKHRDATKALLQSYFKKGGSYLCIAVMDKGDLERAMQEPEAYSSLMVRIGGFSARFVTLAKEMQLEILSRTLY